MDGSRGTTPIAGCESGLSFSSTAPPGRDRRVQESASGGSTASTCQKLRSLYAMEGSFGRGLEVSPRSRVLGGGPPTSGPHGSGGFVSGPAGPWPPSRSTQQSCRTRARVESAEGLHETTRAENRRPRFLSVWQGNALCLFSLASRSAPSRREGQLRDAPEHLEDTTSMDVLDGIYLPGWIRPSRAATGCPERPATPATRAL